MKKYACNNCVFTYQGDALPADFICPICGSGADEFVEISQ